MHHTHWLRTLRLRDVVLLSAPVLALLALVTWNAAHNWALRSVPPAWRTPNPLSRDVGFQLADGGSAMRRGLLLDRLNERAPTADRIDLFVDAAGWQALAADLPASGGHWQRAMLALEGVPTKVRLRLRGDYGIHFFHRKKSLKLRGDAEQLLWERYDLNLSVKQLFQQLFLYRLAAAMGVMAPDARLVEVFRNRAYHGTYLCIEETDELFLRRRGVMPGDVYVGETLLNTLHRDVPDNLWQNLGLWDKDASYNRHGKDDVAPLGRYLAILAEPDRATRWPALRRWFAADEVARYAAFVLFCDQIHMDAVHNLKYFVDPLNGVLHPIVWDPLLQPAYAPKPPTGLARSLLWQKPEGLLYAFLDDPAFLRRVDDQLAAMLRDGLVEKLLAECRAEHDRHRDALAVDRLDNTEGTPYGVDDPELLSARARAHAEGMRAGLRDVGVTWATGTGTADTLTLDLEVRGLGAVDLTALPVGSGKVTVAVAPAGRFATCRREFELTLADGGALVSGPALRFSGGLLPKSPQGLQPTALHYRLELRRQDGQPLRWLGAPAFRDALGEALGADRAAAGEVAGHALFDDSDYLPAQPPRVETLGPGDVTLDRDLVVPPGGTLRILPGTHVRLAPGRNLGSFGDFLAEGTAEAPILIEGTTPAQPFGSVFANGDGRTNRCRLLHVEVRGGSDATIDDVYYNGMVDLRNLAEAVVRDCTFGDNRIGDDCLHVSNSKAELRDCTIRRANADAIDFDLVDGTVTGCRIEDSGNDGLDVMTCRLRVRDCTFVGCGDKGISIGERSDLLATSSRFEGCQKGIEIKDRSFARILDSVFVHSRSQAVNAYRKNWRYGDGGQVELWRCDLRLDDKVHADPHSTIQLRDCQTPPRLDAHVVAAAENGRVRADGGKLPPTNLSGVDVGELWQRAAVLFEQEFDQDFLSFADGWESPGGRATFRKQAHALHAEPATGTLTIARALPPADAQAPRVLELRLKSQDARPVHCRLLQGGRQLAAATLEPAGRAFESFFVPVTPGADRVELAVDALGTGLSLRLVRLLAPGERR